ncbi:MULTISPECIES: 3-dehydroquinate synthase [Aliivibrio]|uniref:3-dehydroquinate synthase n=3 Tax=Aliivibrio fischeri TaxID=668 RepID=AROB_ALIF1|nr:MULTISPECIES: 3-dehydroquinate synthase [Aliivibrio]B5FBN1.1 RecName: Full=3-dehydroquinate synthase; Short=DHQS [Aliivibrio fischeri MJ11]Q5E2G0.1 RecName: Full=3-dehydroquinate synthase; Short=DHQS [Aliivibrio fischeri ES114]AAW86786.1 3-dehydroquinate synthase [Aliivibrio fischeri ES114]ACH65398.1 3-dehydroquinate synthase [Aliivibrio fischeri MJ11]KLU78698.1 3-dehydroquinate synthase [Aliivibrio fischeri]MBD1568536.1 3-dehydroquinate synthase [Aliivibrio sp. S10_S31]MCE4935955.1 3-deh
METIHVDLAERSYPISIGAELFCNPAHFSSVIPAKKRVVVISNVTVAPLYAQQIIDTLNTFECQVSLLELDDGEQYKNLDTFNQILTFLLEENHSRDVTIVALGGGVVGDVVGFASACYQRGVDFIQIPTTLLSQVDSSVGGKTAINHPLGKNMVGAFYQPKAVIIDINCLKTLPEREFAAGMAEVIKYGIIVDREFFDWLDENMDKLYALDHDALIYAISRCCQIKADVVAKDEKESGMRALLNLGHTFGHAIEAEMGYGNWLHGEAVSAGTVMAAVTAQKEGLISQSDVERICSILEKAKLPLKAPKEMTVDAFMKHMMRDKKVLSGKLRLVLPTSIGSSEVVTGVSESVLAEVIEQCKA